jgi:hypothetical protein
MTYTNVNIFLEKGANIFSKKFATEYYGKMGQK